MRTRLSILISALVLLAACAKPVPPEKSAYVGEWRAASMALLITQDGRIVYKRQQAGMSKSIDGPLQGFAGDDFVVGVGPVKTTFDVSAPPHQVAGKWTMVVDGVELTRVE